MEAKKKIELYKRRKVGEVLADAMNFIQYNAKPIFKSLSIIVLPIAILSAYFMKGLMTSLLSFSSGLNTSLTDNLELMTGALIASVISFVGYSVIYVYCANVMLTYENGKLTSGTKLSELTSNLLPFSLKTMVLMLLATLLIIGVGIITGILFSLSGAWTFLFVIIAIVAISVPTSMVFYPLYFKNASIIGSFTEGMQIGFKKWGTTFLILLVVGVFMYLINLFLSIPYYVGLALYGLMGQSTGMGDLGVFVSELVAYIGSFILYFAVFLMTPFVFIPLAFQYCSAREEGEGVSLKDEVAHFDEI